MYKNFRRDLKARDELGSVCGGLLAVIVFRAATFVLNEQLRFDLYALGGMAGEW